MSTAWAGADANIDTYGFHSVLDPTSVRFGLPFISILVPWGKDGQGAPDGPSEGSWEQAGAAGIQR